MVDGYVFYYDLYRANQLAGEDKIDPVELFYPALRYRIRRFLEPTHQAVLFKNI